MTHATIRERRMVTLCTTVTHDDPMQAVQLAQQAHRQRVDRLRMAYGVEEVGAPLVHPFAHVLVAIAEGREIEWANPVLGWSLIRNAEALSLIGAGAFKLGQLRVKVPE